MLLRDLRARAHIPKSAGLMIIMAEDEKALMNKLRQREAVKDTPYAMYLAKQPPNLVGTTDEVATRIKEYEALGIDHFILRFHYGEEIEGMRLFADYVEPNI